LLDNLIVGCPTISVQVQTANCVKKRQDFKAILYF